MVCCAVLWCAGLSPCLLPVPLWTTSPSPPAGFHTFDYARHFLSCCSRMLGLEHETLRGAISIEYYGRNVGIKIMPTGDWAFCFWGGRGRLVAGARSSMARCLLLPWVLA